MVRENRKSFLSWDKIWSLLDWERVIHIYTCISTKIQRDENTSEHFLCVRVHESKRRVKFTCACVRDVRRRRLCEVVSSKEPQMLWESRRSSSCFFFYLYVSCSLSETGSLYDARYGIWSVYVCTVHGDVTMRK